MIGGATALIYYSSPTMTEDIDVFVHLPQSPEKLINLNPIYEYLIYIRRAEPQGQYLIIDGFPVLFLVPYDDLSRDAFEQTVMISYKSVSFKIARLEHLMAIMIQLNKPKYRERLRLLLEEKIFEESYLNTLLERFGLIKRWEILKIQLNGEL
jgi:hypothetical protein